MRQNKILSTIGLAMKAGKVASGEFSTEKTVKAGRAAMVIVAGDASSNTKKKFQNMCAYYHVPIYQYADKAELGHAMGKEERSSMAFLDQGFARMVINSMEAEEIQQLNRECLCEVDAGRNGGNLNGKD